MNLTINLNIDGTGIASFLEKLVNVLDLLTQNVAANTQVAASVVTLLTNLSAQLAAAGTDPVKLKQLADAVAANTKTIADAIIANTPAAPTP